MITKNELNNIQLSATKKDYYQIWNELLELAGKISERWDPTSTNESDPGIVLLKVLTALGDKLNYNVDANILEAFMPSAAQMESMRKLCDMMGYNIKYYQSATTKVGIAYKFKKNEDGTDSEITRLVIPAFTSITNVDSDINYVTTEEKILTKEMPVQFINCIEGQIAKCETDNNNIIDLTQLDDNNRYYLPETQIAENGIFIYRLDENNRSERWKKVENLNTQPFKSLVYKFGYDSKEKRPYIQFPSDIATIIKDGLEISYVRTSGINGNIAPKTLSTFTKPSGEIWDKVDVQDFIVTNDSAATNGANIESITQAYEGYKKIIGTFDTLVTCRDYMNAIYNLMNSSNNPLVSNIVVSDIRDDLNRAFTLCSFDEFGIKYVDTPIQNQGGEELKPFDLVLYPFRTVYGLNTEEEYKNSFKYEEYSVKAELEAQLAKKKNIAHNFVYPKENEIVCIKNYLKLDAKIVTTTKVNIIEEQDIKNTIKAAIYKNFNARKLDFGEEIPYDSILKCIEEADTRIKNVVLDEPELSTVCTLGNNKEYEIITSDNKELTDLDAKKLYNKLVLRNVLAGKIELFNYDTNFNYRFDEASYDDSEPIYPTAEKQIVELQPKLTVNNVSIITKDNPLKLEENEVIKFRIPNITTVVTYPAYVNYHFTKDNAINKQAIPATFISLRDFMNLESNWNTFINNNKNSLHLEKVIANNDAEFLKQQKVYGALFTKSGEIYTKAISFTSGTVYYGTLITKQTFNTWNAYVKSKGLIGITYQVLSTTFFDPGKFVDANGFKYRIVEAWRNIISNTNYLDYFFVQETHQDETKDHTKDGLGKNEELAMIPRNTDYKLKQGERLVINYTPNDPDLKEQAKPVTKEYKEGEIIRPNFDLVDTSKVEVTPKTIIYEGFELKLASLGVKEQIEIRKLVKVELQEPITYLYWNLNDENAAINSIAAQYTPTNSMASYILQENEYLYYTDYNKSALVYYGSGSEIIFYNGANFKSTTQDKQISAKDIILKGINIIPWYRYSFGKDAQSQKIIVQEYKYINLASQDKLISINGLDEINNTWQKVVDATYQFSGKESSEDLPKLDLGTDYKWEVRSCLNVNIGPDYKQILRTTPIIAESLTLKYKDNSLDTLVATQDNPLSLKSNYPINSTLDRIDVKTYKTLTAEQKEEVNDFKIKKFKQEIFGISSPGLVTEPISIHNFGNHLTSINFDDFKSSEGLTKYSKLNLTFPSNSFGLLMINYTGHSYEGTNINNAYLTSTIPLTIFNNQDKWWDGLFIENKYYLHKGINIIKLTKSCEITINPDANSKETLIISDLLVIPTNDPINKNLGYYSTNESNAYNQILADINKIDINHQFYYNCDIDNSNALDISEAKLNKDLVALRLPQVLYDYNNVNNKFVISEIDSASLDEGISIARSSKW